ncbi:MAG: tyrosine-type recombinase/integrase, partial [Actinomycetota bacterium]|nr:tyrosine-type recombinase/integrase [Actinomycetota bacterium]
MAGRRATASAASTDRRSYGTGSLFTYRGAWYGKWRIGDRQVKRKVGPIRQPGSREGLTRKQAEAKLRRLMEQTQFVAPAAHLTFQDVGNRYVDHLEHVMERKRSTVQDYRIILNRHLAPYFGGKAIERITPDDLTAYFGVKAAAGLSTKTISNHLTFAHGVFAFAVKRGFVPTNPVAVVDRPRSLQVNPDIRFLSRRELDALLAAVPDDVLGPTDHALYLTAAMTGLRQGELAALRWRDVDFDARVVRVRRTFTRGRWGTPKSRRSARAVPMAGRVADELREHRRRSAFTGDDDLVFAHPQTGKPY